MNIYLAANFARRFDDLKTKRETLSLLGHKVTSRWIDVPNVNEREMDANRLSHFAYRDIEDIDNSEMLILFSDDTGGLGKFIEFGYAFAQDMDLVVIGKPEILNKESVFYNLQDVTVYSSWREFLSNHEGVMPETKSNPHE